jgi:hypothetical protein
MFFIDYPYQFGTLYARAVVMNEHEKKIKEVNEKIAKVCKENPEWLQKLRKPVKQEKEKPTTRLALLKNFKFRQAVLARINEGRKIEALYPNEHFHKDDIAFGLLRSGRFIAATDFEGVNKEEPGYISHISMIQAMNLEDQNKMETDFKRDERNSLTEKHYLVRGIVKADLKGDILFWETPNQILENTLMYKGVQKCLRELKKRNLIKDDAQVRGSDYFFEGLKNDSLW